MNTPYNIYFKIDNDIYHGAQIRASHQKIELFYHYGNTRNKKVEFENLATGDISSGYLPDHISFHFDGQIHTKAKDSRKKKLYFNELKCDLNPFNLERNNWAPLFLESINISKQELVHSRFKRVTKNEAVNQSILDISELTSFSILLISKCSRVNPKGILSNEHISRLTLIGVLIIADVFTAKEKAENFENSSGFSTEIMVLIVQNVFEEFSEIKSHSTGEIGEQVGISLMTPLIDSIGKMKNLN
jgi:hypothetical protein